MQRRLRFGVLAAVFAMANVTTGPASAATPAVSIRVSTGNPVFHGYHYVSYPHSVTVSGRIANSGWARTSIDGSTFLEGISCPSPSLCVASDIAGNLIHSTNPTATSPTWTAVHVDGANIIHQVSCPTTTLCVAVDSAGNVLTSTSPGGGPGAWTMTAADAAPGGEGIWGVSCPTTTLCVAVDSAGNVLSSTDPSGHAWTAPANITTADLYAVSCASPSLCTAVGSGGVVLTATTPSGAWTSRTPTVQNLYGVSCPTVSFCAAVGTAGLVLTSTDPTGGSAAWTGRTMASAFDMYSVSCPSAGTCLAIDNYGDVAVSTNPTGGTGAWPQHQIDGYTALYNIWCWSATRCVTVDTAGHALVSNNPSSRWNVALRAAAFPFTTTRTVATKLTSTTGHYSFTVHPHVATRYRVLRTSPGARLASTLTTVYVLADVTGSQTPCSTTPTCKVVWNLYYRLPREVAKTEMAKRYYFYLGVRRGSATPPRYIYRDDKARVRSWHVSGDRYRTRVVFRARVGTGAWYMSTRMCRKFTLAKDGYGLPGTYPCGKARVRPTTYLG